MKAFVILAVCLVSCWAVPNDYGSRAPEIRVPSYAAPLGRSEALPVVERKPIIPIVKMTHENDNKGAYNMDFHSGDETKVAVRGTLKDLGGAEGPVNVKSGSYSFKSPEGKDFTVNWTSDENGFHATGDHLPTSPPIPEEIQKGIDRASLPADHPLAESGPLLRSAAPLLRSGYY